VLIDRGFVIQKQLSLKTRPWRLERVREHQMPRVDSKMGSQKKTTNAHSDPDETEKKKLRGVSNR